MTNDNQDMLTAEDHKLFLDIAKEIRKNPTKYREAGKWLDEYCSEESYLQFQENKLKKLQVEKKRIPTLPVEMDIKQLEQEIESKRIPALLIRFQKARDYLLEKYKDQQFIPEEDAKRIILTTWILTEPDAEKADLGITEFEKWSWEPIDDITKLSRGYANFLWFHGGKVFCPWMNLVRIAWSKIKGEKEQWYQTNTFKFVLIPIACTLILAIPAWFAIFRDGKSETTRNSSKEVEEKLTDIENEVPLPTLSLLSKEINQTGSVYVTLLEFESSINQPLGKITFEAKLVNGSGAKIILFSPVGISMDVLKKISSDFKEAHLTYTIIGGYPKLKLETSDTCKILLSGSHITKEIIVEIE